ncbi:uncharacterized protein J3D65DRAFT_459864 [Phyllosticta citribraziliensis]|uniref:Uncharacterized protein n=1 Tax=Phyllosticta citribraziliensis TaxID=989973 RepID=A0ABR1LGQ8_9PEZI
MRRETTVPSLKDATLLQVARDWITKGASFGWSRRVRGLPRIVSRPRGKTHAERSTAISQTTSCRLTKTTETGKVCLMSQLANQTVAEILRAGQRPDDVAYDWLDGVRCKKSSPHNVRCHHHRLPSTPLRQVSRHQRPNQVSFVLLTFLFFVKPKAMDEDLMIMLAQKKREELRAMGEDLDPADHVGHV